MSKSYREVLPRACKRKRSSPPSRSQITTLPIFRYAPLDTTPRKHSIRLLKVLRTRSTYGLLTCELFHGELPTRYHALSYEWGPVPDLSSSGSYRIYVTTSGDDSSNTSHDGVLPVRKNLYDFLVSAVSAASAAVIDSHVPIWIDAICINQDDTQEKNQQVKQMGEIYRGAERVLVWLGSINENQRLTGLFQVLDAKASVIQRHARGFRSSGYVSKTIQEILGDETYDLFLRFLGHSYFRRLWIIQEVFLAREIVVITRDSWIAWKTIGKYSEYFETTKLIINAEVNANTRMTTSKLPSAEFSQLYWGRHKLRYKEANPWDIAGLMNLSKGALCSDPRDRVYGLLSLVPEVNNQFRVDYSEGAAGLFLRALIFFEGETFSKRVSESLMLMRMLGVTFEEVIGHLGTICAAGKADTELRGIEIRGLDLEVMSLKIGQRSVTRAVKCQSCGVECVLAERATSGPLYLWCLNLSLLNGQHFDSHSFHVLFSPDSAPPRGNSTVGGIAGTRLHGRILFRTNPGNGEPDFLDFSGRAGLAAKASIHEERDGEHDCVSMSLGLFLELLRNIAGQSMN